MILRNRILLRTFGFGLLLSLAVGPNARAGLTVIYDNGQTRPIAPLLDPLLVEETPSTDPAENASLNPSAKHGPATLSNLLPVRSPGLRVGNITASSLNPDVLARLAQGNPRPFFFFLADTVSLQWLALHRHTLKHLGAVGLLIQAETEADVRQVADVAQGLPMTLGSGGDLAAALGIDRYPVLITRDGIRQ